MCIVEWTERFFLGQDELKQKTLPPGKEEEEEEEGETSLHTAVLFDVLLSRSKHESVHSNECLFMHSIRCVVLHIRVTGSSVKKHIQCKKYTVFWKLAVRAAIKSQAVEDDDGGCDLLRRHVHPENPP